jgi:hypothetical protein
MARVSSRTIRVTDIPPEITRNYFLEIAKKLSPRKSDGGLFSSARSDKHPPNPSISFAPQYEGYSGTITLPSEKYKTAALRTHGTEWRLDDRFNGVTVLHGPKEPDLESVNRSFTITERLPNSK